MSVDTSESSSRENELVEAISCLQEGGIVAHACEGVWGLACDPYDKTAVQRVLDIKNRDVAKGLLVIGGTVAVFEEELSRLPTKQRQTTALHSAAERQAGQGGVRAQPRSVSTPSLRST